jgi:hypothetical protein
MSNNSSVRADVVIATARSSGAHHLEQIMTWRMRRPARDAFVFPNSPPHAKNRNKYVSDTV